MMRRWTWTDLGVAYSLATLWFLVSWKELLFSGSNDYYAYDLRPDIHHLMIIADVLLLTLVFFVLTVASRIAVSRPARLVFGSLFVVLGVLAFAPLSYELEKLFPTDLQRFRSALLPVLVVVACGFPILRKGISLDLFRKSLRVASLLLLPFCMIVLVKSVVIQTLGNTAHLQPLRITAVSAGDKQPDQKLRSKKVVWIIFDELGYLPLSLANRAGVQTPEMDRLANESFVAHDAYSPAEMTQESIPALLTGRKLKAVEPVSPSDALLIPADKSEPFSFRKGDNIFRELRALGHKAGIVGWYHPYSRLFEGQVEKAYWCPLVDRRCSEYSLFAKCETALLARSLRTIPFAGNLLPKEVQEAGSGIVREAPEIQVERTKFLTEKTYELLADRSLDFLFLHLSIPHKPYIARTGLDPNATYFTSLGAMDDVLAQIRQELEASGQWDDTILIVSSDHPLRWAKPEEYPFLQESELDSAVADERIPFIVRFPGDATRLDYNENFDTVLSRQIIRAIFDSRIQSPRELSFWLREKTIAVDRKLALTQYRDFRLLAKPHDE